jgi:cytochrome d ubiquinol oxidase subunit II
VGSKDYQRRIHLNSIGPVWDGNEVWLVTAGGALFAGFPEAYATLASTFYLPLVLLLVGLIFRACAIEFRSKNTNPGWRSTWDYLFSISSTIIAFALGMVLGHLIEGLPLDAQGQIVREQFAFITPFSLLTGALSVTVFAMHGCAYLLVKTEGEIHDNIREWINPCIIAFIMVYGIATMATLVYMPHMAEPFKQYPALFALPVLGMLAVANIPRQVFFKQDFRAFLSSCASIALLMSVFALGHFPYLVRSTLVGGTSLDIHNSSSSSLSLSILLTFVAIGIPFILSYTFVIYWVFRGKVKLDSMSY